MKSCRIVDYCCGKNGLNFGIDPRQNGRIAAIVDCRYNDIVYYLRYFYRHFLVAVGF